MPVYEYRNDAGQTLELLRPIARRDDGAPRGFKRVTVPRRVALFGTANAPREQGSAGEAVPRAFKALSNNDVHKFVKESGFSVDRTREIWKI